MKEQNYRDILLDKLKYYFDEEDLDIQEKYFRILDQLVDAILFIRYDEVKDRNKFHSFQQLHSIFLEVFDAIDQEPNRRNYFIEQLVIDIVYATKQYNKEIYYSEKVNDLYQQYFYNHHSISKEMSTSLYNEILNEEMNFYISKEKKKLLSTLSCQIPLSSKCLEDVKRRVRVKYIRLQMSRGDFLSFGGDRRTIEQELENIHNNLNCMRLFRRENIYVDREKFKVLDELFLCGNLDLENASSILFGFSPRIVKKIIGKYYKILLPYLENVHIPIHMNCEDISFNYHNYRILNKKQYNVNLDAFMATLDDEKTKYVVENYEKIQNIFMLLPFLHLFSDFTIKEVKSFIVYYDKICDVLLKRGTIVSNFTFDMLYNHLADVIKLAKIYSITDKYAVSLLSEEFIYTIISHNTMTSCNPVDYISVYVDMLKQNQTSVPPIAGVYKNFIFECGNNYDIEKLLIGKRVFASCMGMKGEGEKAYRMSLTGKEGDVLLIKEKNTLEFYARIVVFREGNSIIIAPIKGRNGISNSVLWDEEFLDFIGHAFIASAKENRDALEYVFISHDLIDKKLTYENYNVQEMVKRLPHCDLSIYAYLIAHNDEIQVGISKVYDRTRQKIYKYEEDIKKYMLKIKALQLYMEEDLCKKIFLKLEYDAIEKSEYIKAYIGQDFYVAIRSDGVLEKCVLNMHDIRQEKEIDWVLDDILNDLSCNEFLLDENHGKIILDSVNNAPISLNRDVSVKINRKKILAKLLDLS